MNLAAIETFLAVVETGNLNKAADRLHVTQSTVTTRLDALEDALGQTLLVRSRRGAELTKAGFLFQRHAELIAGTWALSRRTIGLPKNYSGMFSLACAETHWDAAGVHFMDDVAKRDPSLALESWPGTLAESKRWLESGLVDAAITEAPIGGTGLDSRQIPPLRVVQFSTVQRAAVPWHADYVFVDHGPAFRRWHSETWPIDETPARTYGDPRWALEHILENGGSAYLPEVIAKPHLDAARLFAVERSPAFERPAHLTWRTESAARHSWLRDPGPHRIASDTPAH